MKKFLIRTASATVYAVLFIGSICCERLLNNGWSVLMAFLIFVALGCTFEFYRIVRMQVSHPIKLLGYFWVTLMIVAMFIGINALRPFGFQFMTSVVLFAIVSLLSFIVTVVIQLWRRSKQPFGDVAYTLLPMFYIALPLSLMAVLNTVSLLLVVVVLVWVCDSFAFIGGSLMGRHTMWARHSPGKTWEGTAVGVVCTMAVAVLIGPRFNDSLLWIDWVMIGLICGVFGTLGDLVESMLKRSVGVKDSGNIMPGHGGFLDRFDSLLIVVPVVVFYVFVKNVI